MTQVTRYSAIDTDSPLLLPAIGSLNGVLLSCLNTGYTGKSAAGWSIPYSDDFNKVVYRSGDDSNGFYYQVIDDLSSTPNLASLYGYEQMSGLTTGTGKFPSDTQVITPNFSSIIKNSTTPQAARNWLLLANHKLCFLVINPDADVTWVNACLIAFGDFVSLNGEDIYSSFILGRPSNSSNQSVNGNAALSCSIANTLNGHFAVRSYTQFGNSIKFGKHGDDSNAGIQFPNPVDGSLVISRFWITEPGVLRGYIPGLWCLAPAYTNFSHGDTFEGVGDLAGRTFEIIRVYGGAVALETSDTWYL